MYVARDFIVLKIYYFHIQTYIHVILPNTCFGRRPPSSGSNTHNLHIV